jgi:predicted nucleotidyltransferase
MNRLYDDVLAFEASLGVRFDYVLHVGDFGVWPDPNRVDKATRKLPLRSFSAKRRMGFHEVRFFTAFWDKVTPGVPQMIPEIEQHRREIDALCREYGVERLALFCSAATGGFRANSSDLDFLVGFRAPLATGYANRYFGLLEGLQNLAI